MTLLASVIKNFQKDLDKASGAHEFDAILAKAIAYLSGAGPEDLEVLESVVGVTSRDLNHFDDLASGEHRRATPKMYRFLEQGSSAQ